MDEFAKNLLLFALGLGLAIAIFYVWERLPSSQATATVGAGTQLEKYSTVQSQSCPTC